MTPSVWHLVRGMDMLYVREMKQEEMDELHRRRDEEGTSGEMRRRIRVVLLSHEGWSVPDMQPKVDMHPNSIRKWIRRFNEGGVAALESRKRGGGKARITPEQRAEIVKVATTRPEEVGRPFTAWTLSRLRRYLAEEGVVASISHEWIRRILRDAGIRSLRTRTWMTSNDPEYDLKKTA